MNPFRAPHEVVCQDDDVLRQLARADFAHDHMRRARRLLTTLVAVTSIFPWLRSFALSWMIPRALVTVGVTFWAAFGIVALCVRFNEWAYARQRELCLARLSAAMRQRVGR